MGRNKKENRWRSLLRTLSALLLVGALLFAALLAPDAVSAWYDGNSLGRAQYLDMTYEPYEIVCYGSFEEKLCALAACEAEGIELYATALEEEETQDEELLSLVNGELAAMCEAGLLEENIAAAEITGRSLVELCPTEARREIYPQNIFYRELVCETEAGEELSLRMDSEYHRVYSFSIVRSDATAELWWNVLAYQGEPGIFSERWADYWGLADAKIPPVDDVSIWNTLSQQSYDQVVGGAWSFGHGLLMPQGGWLALYSSGSSVGKMDSYVCSGLELIT